MAVTSGAMIAIFTVPALSGPASLGQHLEGQITGRIDADHLERNLAPAASPNLIDRPGIEDLGQLHRLVRAAELDRHWAGEADMPVAAGGEPAEVVRPDDGHAPARPAYPLHLGQA